LKAPHIAICDDDGVFSNYLRTFLALRGYESKPYARGEELLAALRQDDPPRVVLLDVLMPGLNGLDTLRALRTAEPALPVIMLSGREKASTIVEALQLGATDFIVKPGDPDGLGEIALEAAIARAIQRTPLTPDVDTPRRRLADRAARTVLWRESAGMQDVASMIEQVSDSDVTVLIRGETGVGKELVARAIHEQSSRRDRPFIKVNCAALPGELLESELFGHEKGAFTGAAMNRVGKFEQAHRGTIFLDEIGDMKAALQAKLLHVLQDCQFTKLGSNKPVLVEVRVVAATNRGLEAMLLSGEFRQDLYYRLKVIEVTVPPLRERRNEIRQLTEFFIELYVKQYKRPAYQLSANIQQLFQTYNWPGNIRELENMIKRIVIFQDERLVIRELARHGQPSMGSVSVAVAGSAVVIGDTAEATLGARTKEEAVPMGTDADGTRLADIAKAAASAAERIIIEDTLRQTRWNRRETAEQLDVSYKTLLNKMRTCGVTAPRGRASRVVGANLGRPADRSRTTTASRRREQGKP
jgi:two-component system response regulator AtoC